MTVVRSSCMAVAVLLVVVGCATASIQSGDDTSSIIKNLNLPKELSERIKHIVVLMEENRSFDHFFGHYRNKNARDPKTGKPTPQGPVNGLSGNEFNYLNTEKPSDGKVLVSPTAEYINECDPNHNTPPTSFKIFGEKAADAHNFSNPTMSGFVQWENQVRPDGARMRYCGVMESFTPERLPVMTALADEFLLFDNLFASHPGPTWPNRLFFLSGTSAGLTETGPWYQQVIGRLFPQKTIYDQVAEGGGTWKNYFNDTPWEMFLETVAKHPENTVPLDDFFYDARTGNLPDFSFINPRVGINFTAGLGANDQHPDHDVALGEALYKDVYEALRASPQWNETLFVLTYDEHGGFFDHVPTPLDVPPPADGRPSFPDKNFQFDRLGVRIPTLLISPWIQKGKVKSNPTSRKQMPAYNSMFDLTSIISSSRKILKCLENATALTKRDAWVATWEDELMMLDQPRTDCLTHLPDPPKPTTAWLEHEAALPINGLQEHVMTFNGHLAQAPYPKHIKRQGDVGDFLKSTLETHKQNAKQWKASKAQLGADTHKYVIQFKAADSPHNTRWTLTKADPNSKTGDQLVTIATPGMDSDDKNLWFCLDAGNLHGQPAAVGAEVGISHCFPSIHPDKNVDNSQKWIYTVDSLVKPITNLDLCLTNTYEAVGDGPMTLQKCVPNAVNQHYAYMGKVAAYSGSGALAMGNSCVDMLHKNATSNLAL